MSSPWQNHLVQAVLEASVADNWKEAVGEWEISDCEEDLSGKVSCICGKEHLRYLFTIRNLENGNRLFPIGSSCIQRFERTELREEADVFIQKHRLYDAVESGTFLTLSPEFFSRKLLAALCQEGAFPPSRYNDFDGCNDYQFLLDMFNKRKRSTITPGQHRKIRALMRTICQHLRETLKFRER